MEESAPPAIPALRFDTGDKDGALKLWDAVAADTDVDPVLRDTARLVDVFWQDLTDTRPGDPIGQLHEWVRSAASYASMEGGGCDLVTAAFELPEPDHPARLVVETFKREQRDRLVALCHAAGIADAEKLADTLALLLEGARVNRRSVGPDGASANVMAIAEAVIASFSAASAKARETQPEMVEQG